MSSTNNKKKLWIIKNITETLWMSSLADYNSLWNDNKFGEVLSRSNRNVTLSFQQHTTSIAPYGLDLIYNFGLEFLLRSMLGVLHINFHFVGLI